MAEATRVIGAVAVKVRPDTGGFRRKTKAGILKELRSIDAKVDIDLNVDLEKLRRDLNSIDGKKVRVDIEVDSNVDKAIGDTERELNKLDERQKKRKLKFYPDHEGVKKAISDIEAEIRELGAQKIELDLDRDGLESALSEMRDRLTRTPIELKYVNDREGLEKAISDIDGRLRSMREQTLSVNFNEEDLDRARRELVEKLAQRPLELKVDFNNLESLRNAKRELERQLGQFKEVKIEVNADRASIQKALDDIEDAINKAERQDVDLTVNAHALAAAAQLKYMSRPRFVDFFVRVNKRSIAIAEGILQSLAGWNVLTQTGRALESLVTQFDKITVKGGAWAAAIGGIADTLSYLLTATLGVADGILDSVGLFATLPAVLSTLAAVVAINVAAWKDFGAAVDGDNAALAKLPPNAQKAAQSLRGAWTAIQKPVQRKFWDGMGDEFSKMAKLLIPQFRDGLTAAAEHVGAFGAGVSRAFQKIALNGDLKKMFAGLEGFFDNLAGAAEPFVDALNTLGLRGSEYLPRFGEWLTELAVRFDNFIQKADQAGDINRWIEDGVKSMQDMGRVILGVTDIFQGLTGAAYDAGVGGLSEFADTMQRIGRIVEGEPFRSQMANIFRGANEGASRLNEGMRDLGNSFMENSEYVGTLLKLLGDLGGEALKGIATAFNNLEFQHGVLDAVDGLIAGVKDLRPAFEDAGAIVGAFGSIAGAVFTGITPILNQLASLFRDVMADLGPELEALAPVLSRALGSLLSVAEPIIVALADGVTSLLTGFNALPAPLQTAAVLFTGLSVGAGHAVKAFFDIAPAAKKALEHVRGIAEQAPKTATALSKIGKFAAVAAAGLAAVQLVGSLVSTKEINSAEDYAAAIDGVALAGRNAKASDLDQLFQKWDLTAGAESDAEAVNTLSKAIDTLADPTMSQKLKKWAEPFTTFLGSTPSEISQVTGKFDELGDALGNLVRNGESDKAAKTFRLVAEEFERTGKTAQDAADMMPGYMDGLRAIASEAGVAVDDTELLNWALSGVQPEAVTAAQGLAKTEEALQEVGVAADGTVTDVEKFLDVLFRTGLATMDSRDAAFEYQKRLREVGDTAKELANGKLGKVLNDTATDFNTTTEAGARANEVFQALARGGMDEVRRMAVDGVGQDKLQEKLRKTYDDLVNSGQGFGLSAEAAKTLAREVLGVPDSVDIDTWMSDHAKLIAEQTVKAIDELPGHVEVAVVVSENGTAGEIQKKVDAITGKTEYVFVDEAGTARAVQQKIVEIDGVERTVWVDDDGTIYGTQQNIDAMTGTEVDIDAKDNATAVVNTAQVNVNGFSGKVVDVVAQFIKENFPEVKDSYDSIKSKVEGVVADFKSWFFPETKANYDSIKHKEEGVWATFRSFFFPDTKKNYDSIQHKEEGVWATFRSFFFPDTKKNYDSIKHKEEGVWATFRSWFFPNVKSNYDSIKHKEEGVWATFRSWFFSSVKGNYDAIKAKESAVWAVFTSWFYSTVKSNYDKIKSKTVEVITKFISQFFSRGGINGMDGGLNAYGSGQLGMAKGLPKTRAIRQYADGGLENHTAQIAFSRPSAPIRIWAEPETGGEAYIPLSPSKRQRSVSIWQETGRRLGVYEDGGIDGGTGGSASSSEGRGPVFNIVNHYPQAEPTSVTINRSMQYAAMPGLSD